MTDDGQTAKVIELIGESSESWEHAAQNAVEDAAETIEGVNGVEVASQTAEVEAGEIVHYRTTLHVSFPIQR